AHRRGPAAVARLLRATLLSSQLPCAGHKAPLTHGRSTLPRFEFVADFLFRLSDAYASHRLVSFKRNRSLVNRSVSRVFSKNYPFWILVIGSVYCERFDTGSNETPCFCVARAPGASR